MPSEVRKFGNSLGIVLPEEVINQLQTGDGQSLFLVDAPDGSYRLRVRTMVGSKRK